MPAKSGFRRVGRVEDFPLGRGRAVEVDGVRVAIFRLDDRVLALKDACPHMGASLADGKLEAGRVTCHMHGWRFDLATGICPETSNLRAVAYAVRVENGEVWVKPPDPPPAPPDEDWVVFDPDKHLKKKR